MTLVKERSLKYKEREGQYGGQREKGNRNLKITRYHGEELLPTSGAKQFIS